MLTFFINSFYNMKNILNLKKRGRSSVGRYHTKQQTLILEYLALKKDTAFTAESVWRGLLGVEEKVGRALSTVRWTAWWRRARFSKFPLGMATGHSTAIWGKQPSPPAGGWSAWTADGISPGSAPILEELTRHIQSDHQLK